MWGCGHSGGTWLLGAMAILFREAIPVDSVSEWSERFVGVILIGIGLWSAQRVLRSRMHMSEAPPSDAPATAAAAGAHGHRHGHSNGHSHARGRGHGRAALGVGTLHGLAGTSHLLGILPALALPSRGDSIVYVVAFGLGSIIAMTAFAAVLGGLAARGAVSGKLQRSLMSAASLAAIGIGVFWLAA